MLKGLAAAHQLHKQVQNKKINSTQGKRDLRLRIRAVKKLLKKFAATHKLHDKHVTVDELLQKKGGKMRQKCIKKN